MYYDPVSSRSPGAHRHQQQTLHRQPSRQFDAYGPMPNNIYPQEDHNLRYDNNRFDRMNQGMQNGGYTYEPLGAQSWNPTAFGGGNSQFPNFGATGRMKPPARGRSGLPPTWLDQPQLPSSNPFPGFGGSHIGGSQLRQEQYPTDPDDELIPTAIVIKNIPFAVKKEQLVDIMTQMGLPLPYAFNYHFDNGVFRGLAFANFTSADETAQVITGLNHFELQGRKLRVEYKKMLPLQERERIEREKRERRGQLEEQHRPLGGNPLHSQPSMSSMSSHVHANSPSPLSAQNGSQPGFDLNDAATLGFYSELLLFKDDHSREALIFPTSVTPAQRRVIHTLAHHMGLAHISNGENDRRQVHVFRAPQGSNLSPPIPQVSTIHAANSQRGLNRAATIDFNEVRNTGNGVYNTLRGQQSSGFLGIPDSPGGFGAQQNLRAAKSFADLRSYTPSPVASTASFPAALSSQVARLQTEYAAGTAATMTPTLTPTASGSAIGQHRDDTTLVNGFSGMSLGGNSGPQSAGPSNASTFGPGGPNSGSPRRLRGMFSWDQDTQTQPTGPIGSNRSFSVNFDDQSRDRSGNLPMRQPRGPAERGPGFSRGRQNGHQSRGSDEMRSSSGVEIIVE